MKTKILYYNWVQFDDPSGKGGGVTIYQNNILQRLAQSQRYDLYFLSSGTAYSLSQAGPFVRQTSNCFAPSVKTFEIVNSPIVSPSHSSFFLDQVGWNIHSVHTLFVNFLKENGPFDVIHFQNLEGLPLSIVSSVKSSTQAKIIFSVHNYYAVCPQVNLWFQEHQHCKNFNNGKNCCVCLIDNQKPETTLMRKQVRYYRSMVAKYPVVGRPLSLLVGLEQFQSACKKICRKIISEANPFDASFPEDKKSYGKNSFTVTEATANKYATRRQEAVQILNENVDVFLCVSERVREILTSYGFVESKLFTCYIGTRFGDNAVKSKKVTTHPGVLQICYLGYMRRDKGFYFFLDTLNRMRSSIAGRLRVVIAAKCQDSHQLARMRNLAPKFASFEYMDGYNHDQLEQILGRVHLGIVPVIWEDCLPQVAIEFVAHGIPILASDRGGARELSASNRFVFRSGSRDDFIQKLAAILDNPGTLSEYWQGGAPIIPLNKHVSELERFYKSLLAA